jgi:hypothetical protein
MELKILLQSQDYGLFVTFLKWVFSLKHPSNIKQQLWKKQINDRYNNIEIAH